MPLATVAKPFGSTRIFPLFDFGEVVNVSQQENGLYTVTKNGREPDATSTVEDVPPDRLDFSERVK